MKLSYLKITLILLSSCSNQSSTTEAVASNENQTDSLVVKADTLNIDDGEAVYVIVDEMPRFPGCEEEEPVTRKHCSDRKLLTYFYSNIKFDPVARENDAIETKMVFSFVVEKDGTISNFELIKDAQWKGNIKEVVESMPLWIPGKLRGVPKRVKWNSPLRVHLK